MIIECKENHRVIRKLTYDIPKEEILEVFETTDKFLEAMWNDSDEFHEFVADLNYDVDEDWITMRKGGYETDWDLVEDEED